MDVLVRVKLVNREEVWRREGSRSTRMGGRRIYFTGLFGLFGLLFFSCFPTSLFRGFWATLAPSGAPFGAIWELFSLIFATFSQKVAPLVLDDSITV